MVLFLFGSGVSRAPKVGDLTKKVLDFHTHKEPLAELKSSGLWCAPDEKRLPALLTDLADRIGGEVTYEDIAEILSDLVFFDRRRTTVLEPFWQQLAEKYGNRNLTRDGAQGLDFRTLCMAARLWIRLVVFHELKPHAGNKLSNGVFEFLRSIQPNEQNWAAATLNHDLVLEEALGLLGADVELGFRMKDGFDEFDPSVLRNPARPLLLKLHGSIDWHYSPWNVSSLVSVVVSTSSLPKESCNRSSHRLAD